MSSIPKKLPTTSTAIPIGSPPRNGTVEDIHNLQAAVLTEAAGPTYNLDGRRISLTSKTVCKSPERQSAIQLWMEFRILSYRPIGVDLKDQFLIALNSTFCSRADINQYAPILNRLSPLVETYHKVLKEYDGSRCEEKEVFEALKPLQALLLEFKAAIDMR